MKPVLQYQFLFHNRLKKENDELKRIIGLITLELERGKKNRNCQ